MTINANSVVQIRLVCSGSKVAVNGGFVFTGHEQDGAGIFAERFLIVSNGPPTPGSTTPIEWVIFVRNNTNNTGVGYAYYYCATPAN
ncbi:MAG: hypothetical protein R2856_12615 [Caldilineaceae bacterium]